MKHRYVDVPGVRLHVAEAGEGSPILLLHGWPQHWWIWRKVIPALAENYRVICPDLRGFGWSEAPVEHSECAHIIGAPQIPPLQSEPQQSEEVAHFCPSGKHAG